MVVADVPGLIEGASEGKGLGHRFLRHVERARVLVVLIDLAPTAPAPPAEQEEVLLRELGAYRPELLERPRLLVGAKADVATEPWDGLRMSAVTGEGIADVLGRLRELVESARTNERDDGGFVIHRPEPEGVEIERLGEHEFRVHGRAALRAVALSDMTDADALAYADHRLKQLGVGKALTKAGAQPGDVVWIGAFSFDYEPEL